MAKIGYARVSTAEQGLDVQQAALKEAGCTTIRAEKRSGTSTQDRTELQIVLDFLRPGDELVVTRIDRLAGRPNVIDVEISPPLTMWQMPQRGGRR